MGMLLCVSLCSKHHFDILQAEAPPAAAPVARPANVEAPRSFRGCNTKRCQRSTKQVTSVADGNHFFSADFEDMSLSSWLDLGFERPKS